MTVCHATPMLVHSVLLAAGLAGAAAAGEPTAPNRIVARDDYGVDSAFLPPVIMERHFWNMLPPYPRPDSPQGKAMAEFVGTEPMVRDAAVHYSLKDLRAAGDDPLAVNADRLLKMTPDPRRPFIVSTNAGRPPFRCMDDFRVDDTAYRRWKQEHPNFLGFWTGTEWDNEYIGPLGDPARAVESARKHGLTEEALRRMQAVLARASADREAAAAGLQECHKALRRYYFDDPGKMLFLRAGWCLDHYALEWGAGMTIMETTNTGPYRHQASLFFTRGAARQYGKPWQWYMATFYNGFDRAGKASVNNEPDYIGTRKWEPGEAAPGCGMSVSLKRRDMYLAYLSGASLVEHEDWPRVYCQYRNGNPQQWELSPHGEAMQEWYGFTQRYPERGVSYAPVALLVPFSQGMPQWGGSPWSRFSPERADAMVDAFFYTVAPFSQNLREGKEGCLANGEFGDLYDVLVPNPPSGPIPLATLLSYKVAILLGKVDVDAPLAARLMEYVRQGGTLVVNSRQIGTSLPVEFTGATPSGQAVGVAGPVLALPDGETVSLTEPYDYQPVELRGAEALWRDASGGILASVNRVGRGRVVLTTVDSMVPRKQPNLLGTATRMPLVALLMRQIVREVVPLQVSGDIEYGFCKVPDGWWVYLINNNGVTKFTNTPEELDPAATAQVTVALRTLRASRVCELRQDRQIAVDEGTNAFRLEVGPGDIRVVKITVISKEGP